ncbi:hypothetical protein [Methylobacterium sp. AMS5]|uniref:hypothetical protein n=1 Tax=Methylobacterium sp. AMS5 TaxID=925818 RepID=UPI00074FA1E6|nr:hypothetical protein [Methylobacterium sp. AMS5]AMB48375.1 hypothetical protein Y590_25740 [Methylobacterium sp. AMS5]
MTDIALAPGCYGFALSFKEGSPECSTCPFAGRCQAIGAEQLARRRAELGIVAPVKRTRTPSPAPAPVAAATAAPGALTSEMPKKVAELLARIERMGIKVTEALAEGRNPFAGTKIGFLAVACHLMMKLDQGVERALLIKAFQQKLNWSEGTAAAHATQAFQALEALGAASNSNGRLTLMRN